MSVANFVLLQIYAKILVSLIVFLVLTPINKMGFERKHQHAVEMGLSLLAHSSLAMSYWADAFETAVYLINLLSSPVLQHRSPYFMVYHKHPDFNFLKIFGCECWPSLRPNNRHKLNFRSASCLFLNYSPSHKRYKCLDIKNNCLYISQDVIFNENNFSYKKPTSSLHN